MDVIILNDGLYQLIPVTKQIMDGIVRTAAVDCFNMCDILRIHLTGYADSMNVTLMTDGMGACCGGLFR